MRFRECLTLAAHFCLLKDEFDSLSSCATDFGASAEGVNFLIRCGNLVVREIATNYIQLRKKETICAGEGGEILYSQFSRVPVAVLGIKRGGANVFYKEFPAHIEIGEAGEVEIEYAYLPDTLEADDELPFGGSKPDARIIAYGIASEYYLIHGQVEEAVVWDRRYRDGLSAAQLKKSEVRVRKRSWW